MDTIYAASLYARAGYVPLPAFAGAKHSYQTHTDMTTTTYNFSVRWGNAEPDGNVVLKAYDTFVCVDFDNHGESPSGLDALARINALRPGMMASGIIEITGSGGYHFYFAYPRDEAWQKVATGRGGHDVYVTVDRVPVGIEVKYGTDLIAATPSVNSSGDSYHFETTPLWEYHPEELSPLPKLFYNKPLPTAPVYTANAPTDDDFSLDNVKDRQAFIDQRVEQYAAKAHEGIRYKTAQTMVAWLYHVGATQGEREDALRHYAHRLRWEDKAQIKSLINWHIR